MTIPAGDSPYLAAVSDAPTSMPPVASGPASGSGSRLRSFVGRHPLAMFLGTAYVVFWLCWAPVLFLGAPPRLFSALGALLGMAVPAFLVTAAADGRAGVRDLLRRMLRWRVGIGWYVLAGALKASLLVALAFAFLICRPISGRRSADRASFGTSRCW